MRGNTLTINTTAAQIADRLRKDGFIIGKITDGSADCCDDEIEVIVPGRKISIQVGSGYAEVNEYTGYDAAGEPNDDFCCHSSNHRDSTSYSSMVECLRKVIAGPKPIG